MFLILRPRFFCTHWAIMGKEAGGLITFIERKSLRFLLKYDERKQGLDKKITQFQLHSTFTSLNIALLLVTTNNLIKMT